VQLPPTEAVDFEAALVTEFDAIATAVSRVDSRRAVCFTPDDEAMIHDAIERRLTGGHRGLDALLAEALRGWLAQGRRLAAFNRVLAAVLVATAGWMAVL
jgi:hypothetical protein